MRTPLRILYLENRSVVNLRRAQPGDAEVIAAIHTEARREAMPWLPELHSDDEPREWVATTVLPKQQVWIAEAGDEIIGYVSVDGGELNDLYVRPG